MRWRGIIGGIGLVVATLLATEIVVRVATWEATSPERIDDGLGGQRYSFYPDGVGDLVPNQDGHWLTWHHRPYHVESNSLGLRANEEPVEGALRILATGDSQTFGAYVTNEDAWPGWLQARLRNEAKPARAVQVFNAGISGYSIVNQLAWLKEKAIAARPDLVILAVFENDIADLRKHLAGTRARPASERDRDDQLLRYWIKRIRKTIGDNVATYTLVKNLRTRAEMRDAGVDTRRGEGEATRATAPVPDSARLAELYAGMFREFVTSARGAGIAVAVIAIPDTTAIEARASGDVATLVARLARELRVPFLDLLPDFTAVADPIEALYLLQWDAATKDWRGNGHLSREGHRLVGTRTAAWLRAQEPPLLAR